MENQRNPRTKILSLALTGMMVLSLLPMGVFAESGNDSPGGGNSEISSTASEPGKMQLPEGYIGSFIDLPRNHWAYANVKTSVSWGWMNGLTETTFGPNESITYGTLVQALYRMSGNPNAGVASSLDWAKNNGIIGKVNTDNAVTREQLVVILYSYASVMGYDLSKTAPFDYFADANRVDNNAKKSISWAIAVGLISGKDGQTLAPTAVASRAEVATILVRLSELPK